MHTRTLRAIARGVCALAIAAAVSGGVGCHRGGKQPDPSGPEDAEGPIVGNRDLRVTPPGVETATIQRLDGNAGGNALLEVTYEKQDRPLPSRLRVFFDDTGTILRDDGAKGDAKARDGVYSAVTRFDFEELRRQPELARRQLASERPQLVFRGREVIGVVDPGAARARAERLSKLENLDAILRDKTKIDLFDIMSTVPPSTIDPERSLMITDSAVVQDPSRTVNPCTAAGNPNGTWTFKHLVTEMVAGTGLDPADFTERWLRLWLTNQPVSSGFAAAPRATMATEVLNAWPRKNGKLDLDRSPFRLAAIVNRIDLGKNLVYGAGNAGEGRFVFGVQDRTQAPGCRFLPFSVIFEYAVPRKGCLGVKSWAQKWVDLGNETIGSPAYNAALEAITETFAKAGAAPNEPNGSALAQLRTNENALNPLWELREFKIDRASHLLFEDTVKQTPDETLNNGAVLAQYITQNQAAILDGTYSVPDFFPNAGDRFRAATSRASANQLNTHFRAPATNTEARHLFSLGTCSACHIRETGTNGLGGSTRFLHVDPQPMPADLSRFLTGATPDLGDSAPFPVPDPVSGQTRLFNDLDNRRQKLAEFAGASCFKRIAVTPRNPFVRLPPPIGPDDRLPQITDLRLNSINDPVRFVH